ncbi:hypothetical protein B808_712 [Fructilactobacillus florum 8D]|uniref:Uncharacterized protein n=2 Tax=Fructilactobacillus florum TaxID=640331 RepID=W9EE47_9LACO|nr:hypothetical protein [Fructilactobacillus florum]EKK20392.1 hypothetical protein B807_849 [Fructilactobacillus florum 2F]ETO40362.1 hypothetical protein B808_712 [Fructilactobacillus florum 8D]KRM92330.1 hypothetical protein FC87_GL000463 [Fructilactobacillus florum DSM 22689 = JCM 16035]
MKLKALTQKQHAAFTSWQLREQQLAQLRLLLQLKRQAHGELFSPKLLACPIVKLK